MDTQGIKNALAAVSDLMSESAHLVDQREYPAVIQNLNKAGVMLLNISVAIQGTLTSGE